MDDPCHFAVNGPPEEAVIISVSWGVDCGEDVKKIPKYKAIKTKTFYVSFSKSINSS